MESRPVESLPAGSSRRSTLLAIVGVSVFTAALAVFFAYHESRSVNVGIRSYDITRSPASVTFEVDKPSGRAYHCRIEVQDVLHDPIGVASAIPVPAGHHQVVQTVQIPFEGKATAVEITDCVRS